jgi:hypothetical protein
VENKDDQRPSRVFNFQLTVQSHGWYDLLAVPVRQAKSYARVRFRQGGKVVNASIRHSKEGLNIELDGRF